MICHYLLPRALTGLSLVAMLSSIAFSQTRTTTSSKTFSVSPVSVTSTYDIQPQIQPSPQQTRTDVAAENDYTPALPRERANSLRAGGFMSVARGTPRSLFPGPVDARLVPPDCNMAVGPDHVVTVINSTIAIFTKTGTKTLQVTMDGANGFFAGTAQTGFVFDPKCFYDPIAKRFFVVALDLNSGSSISNCLVAVSDDENPNGTWFKYRINSVVTSGGSSFWLDYPGFGFNKDAVIITGNMFGFTNGYFGVQALVLQKAPLLTGGTATVNVLLEPGTGTVQPTRTADKLSDKIFAVASGGGNAVRFYAFTNLTTTPVMKEIDVAVPSYSSPPPVASGSNQLDALDGRVMTANFRLGQVVAAHTIGVNGAAAVRWYDFNVGNWPTSGAPTLKQSGNITGSGVGMHMPAININSFEDISVFYTRSGPSIGADLMISSRFKSDPLNQIGQPVKLFGSPTSNYTSFRWGDYFGNEVDPLDDATFWGFGMSIGPDGVYQTQILKWIVSTPGPANGTPISADSTATFVGNSIIGDPVSVAASDDINYQIGSESVSRFGQAAGVESTFTVPNTTTNMTIMFETVGGVAGGTNMVWLFNHVNQSWDLIGSAPLAASGNVQKFLPVASAALPKYIGPTGVVKMRLRGHLPIKPFVNAMPLPFTYRIDVMQLFVR